MELNEQLKKIKEILDKHKGAAHILTPIPREGDLGDIAIPPYKRVVCRTVWIDPDPDQQTGSGEVYTLKQFPTHLILTKIGLQKLGDAAGIEWFDLQQFVNQGEPLVAAASIAGSITNLDGTKRVARNRDYQDLRDGSAQAAKKNPASLAVARASILSLVTTGAKNKVRRELLNVKGFYLEEELKKPFILFSLIDDASGILRDFPDLKRGLAAQILGIGQEVFGRGTSHAVGPATPVALIPERIEEPEVVQTTVEEILKENVDPRAEKISLIEEAYKKKGLVRGANKPPLSTLTDSQLDSVLEALSHHGDKQ